MLCGLTAQLISAPIPQTSPIDAANRLFEERNYSQAEKAFRELLATTVDIPTRGKATFNLGITLQRLGRFKEAITVFEGLIGQAVSDKEPGAHLMEPYRNYRPRAQWEIGNSFRAMNDYAQALTAYRVTREKYPFQSWCGNERAEYEYRYAFFEGLCLEHLGRFPEALAKYFTAAFYGRMFYSEPEVHFRIVALYGHTGQMGDLERLLAEIDADVQARIRKQAEADQIRVSSEDLARIKPTAIVRRIIELRTLGSAKKWSELIGLLKIQGNVTGPPDDGGWEAEEAARILALTPAETVPLLIAAVRSDPRVDERWIAYALGRCGGAEAVAWIRQRVLKEENFWAARSFVFALSLAGTQGREALDALSRIGTVNTKIAIDHLTAPSDKPAVAVTFPKLPEALRLPVRLKELKLEDGLLAQ